MAWSCPPWTHSPACCWPSLPSLVSCPPPQVSRLPAADTYKEYAVKQLKRDNLLRTFYRDGVRGLRLTVAAKDLLMASWPDQFSLYLSGSV